MFRRIAVIVVMIIAGFAGIAGEAFADRRSYVWTYEYQTMPKGMAEIEYYLTEEHRNIEKTRPSTWKHWIELEYGVTDHFDISMYQQFKQSNTVTTNTFEYDGFKLRGRYRIMEKEKLPVDTLLYFEYQRNDNLQNPNVMELKTIFAKDIANFNIAYNQVFKQELAAGGKTDHEYATGISYRIIPSFKVGVESKGNYGDRKYYAGPTISWSSSKFWIAAGVVGGLNKRSDDLQARMIVGVVF